MSGLHQRFTAPRYTATLSFVFRKEPSRLKRTLTVLFRASPHTDTTPKEKKAGRKYGQWLPVTFQYPPVKASPQEPAELKPIPYRPFRHGQY
ncbi:hypothetical protein C0992_007084 [Termitomyces sp. T32_za158]|nr:hypothetical protein C0992_007084 [Termitomyces sp. T32_za158]